MELPRMIRRQSTLLAFLLVGVAPLAYADLQDVMNARWRGAWVIVAGELYSNCNGATTNNRVSGNLVSGSGRYAFDPGELAQVTEVD